ncbi:hypothetical protein FHW83_005467 [Duganella sp. SG902]|uniref:PIG-L family deacetylase n=1 Tax=Duganella sp. SG902 TaxID=2587016 RepID=UPI00159CFA6E|nr:PIG-L family deacetylase [Duganella sp. SG902]NVM79626.1 hypothetical protein [Duganella sp. SG902]
MVKRFSKFAISLAAGAVISASAQAAVYVVAHPDDDILMMGPNLINDIKQNYPTVIIVVTAGDAGKSYRPKLPSVPDADQNSFNSQSNPYYRVRLTAREYALNLWVPSSYARPLARSWVNLGSGVSQVERIQLGNVVEYHLNLPDQVEGSGKTTIQSLRDMAGYVTHDVEGLNTYSAATLRGVIRTIISSNFHNTPILNINYQSPQAVTGEHPDHIAVGAIVQAAINEVPSYKCMGQAIYDGYSASAVSTSDPKFYFPGLVAAQRAGYEQVHAVLKDQGNITPIDGGIVNMGTPASTTTPYATSSDSTPRQMGTMDGFHTSFYGKSKWTAVASTGSCNL